MGDRERKRAARQKRKRRSAERAAQPPDSVTATASQSPETAATETFQEKMARRYEERNAEARAKLQPVAAGERPTAVTVGAIVSTLLALAISVQAVLALAGVDAGEATTRPVPLILFAAVLWAMAVGMWRARYWAVLGFQTLLLLILIASALGLVLVSSVLQAIGTTVLLLGSAALFYFMIRAMARIQMPRSPRAD